MVMFPSSAEADRFGCRCLALTAGEIADPRGDHGYPVAARGQVAGELVVTRPAGLIEGRKGLVDQQDMHYSYLF